MATASEMSEEATHSNAEEQASKAVKYDWYQVRHSH